MVTRNRAKIAIRLSKGGSPEPGLVTELNGDYLVKTNFNPAIRRTVARNSEITRTAKRLLPKCEPTMPPMIAAAARMRPSEGIERTFVKYPTSPAIEFTQMN